MRKSSLLSSAAVIVLLSGSVALAQGLSPDRKEGAAPAPAAQQNAPAEKMAPSIQHGQRATPETTGQGAPDRLAPGHGANGQDDPTNPAQKPPETTGQNSPQHGASDMKNGANAGANVQERNEGNEHPDRMGQGGNGHERATTGQGAAGSGHLSHEQRSRITTIFHGHRGHRIDHLNISVRVGARLPGSVHFYPVPTEVIAIYPEWRGYDYVYVGDQILIIDPATHEIVAVLEA
jgi:hypothetical protein